jgi:hypothetical protein
VVDWDAWHPSGVPGTDLLHLVAASEAARSQRTFAELLADRSWRRPLLTDPALRRYWADLEIVPGEELLDCVLGSWWASQTAVRLARSPADAADPEWRRRNVAPVAAWDALR